MFNEESRQDGPLLNKGKNLDRLGGGLVGSWLEGKWWWIKMWRSSKFVDSIRNRLWITMIIQRLRRVEGWYIGVPGNHSFIISFKGFQFFLFNLSMTSRDASLDEWTVRIGVCLSYDFRIISSCEENRAKIRRGARMAEVLKWKRYGRKKDAERGGRCW